jgi:hypothetical protein
MVMLDTNELFFDNSISLTFIEPFPERFYSLCNAGDEQQFTLIEKKLQHVNTEIFNTLEAGDFLFVDSTHVSKTGSDVNKIFFEILPLLKEGVIVHFHDVFFPFEYPKDWVLGWSGFGWNEVYILKAFLTNNNNYEILLFNTYLEHVDKDWFYRNMALCMENTGGSIWIKKLIRG